MKQLRDVISEQPPEVKKVLENLVKTTNDMVAAGRNDLAVKYLMHNRQKFIKKHNESVNGKQS